MGQFLLLLVVALVVAAIVFGVITLISDDSSGLAPAEPDGQAVPLPGARPLTERDLVTVRFDTELRGYRMSQVDQALRRAAYDVGYKEELIVVLEAEVEALRAGRFDEAEQLRRSRIGAVVPTAVAPSAPTADAAEPGSDAATDPGTDPAAPEAVERETVDSEK